MSHDKTADGTSRLPSATGSAAGKKGKWVIEYEIPPMRAIYFAWAINSTEDEAREMVRKEQPLWRIRKVQRHNDRTERPTR